MDAFAKPRDDLRSTSALGGIVTIVASAAASLLFMAQLYLYLSGITRHSLQLSESAWTPVRHLHDYRLEPKGRIRLKVHVSFPELECRHLDLKHDSMSANDPKFSKVHGVRTYVKKRPMSAAEYKQAKGERGTNSLHATCNVQAEYDIAKVGGTVSIGLTQQSWSQASSFLIMGLGMGMAMPGGNRAKARTGFNMT